MEATPPFGAGGADRPGAPSRSPLPAVPRVPRREVAGPDAPAPGGVAARPGAPGPGRWWPGPGPLCRGGPRGAGGAGGRRCPRRRAAAATRRSRPRSPRSAPGEPPPATAPTASPPRPIAPATAAATAVTRIQGAAGRSGRGRPAPRAPERRRGHAALHPGQHPLPVGPVRVGRFPQPLRQFGHHTPCPVPRTSARRGIRRSQYPRRPRPRWSPAGSRSGSAPARGRDVPRAGRPRPRRVQGPRRPAGTGRRPAAAARGQSAAAPWRPDRGRATGGGAVAGGRGGGGGGAARRSAGRYRMPVPVPAYRRGPCRRACRRSGRRALGRGREQPLQLRDPARGLALDRADARCPAPPPCPSPTGRRRAAGRRRRACGTAAAAGPRAGRAPPARRLLDPLGAVDQKSATRRRSRIALRIRERARFATTPRAYAAGCVGGLRDAVPVPPHRHQRVGREVVGGVRLAGQQVGQAGEFGVVPLEERVEPAASSVSRRRRASFSADVPTVTSSCPDLPATARRERSSGVGAWAEVRDGELAAAGGAPVPPGSPRGGAAPSGGDCSRGAQLPLEGPSPATAGRAGRGRALQVTRSEKQPVAGVEQRVLDHLLVSRASAGPPAPSS